jgi:hypothetical protein
MSVLTNKNKDDRSVHSTLFCTPRPRCNHHQLAIHPTNVISLMELWSIDHSKPCPLLHQNMRLYACCYRIKQVPLRLGDAKENDGLLLACPRANQDGILLGKACVIFQRLADQAMALGVLILLAKSIGWS